jgi:beta-lactamase class A
VPQWLHLMIGMSDNTATKTLVAAVGKDSVNRWLETRGFAKTRLVMGGSGYGSTTPNEMVRLFELIRAGKAASPAACDRLLRMLSHQYWDDRIASQIPPTVRVFSKSGSISRARSDVALVVAPNVEYLLAVFTRDQADASWRRQNEGMELIRRLSAHTWRRLNPRDPWRPPDGYEALLPPNGP